MSIACVISSQTFCFQFSIIAKVLRRSLQESSCSETFHKTGQGINNAFTKVA